MLYVLRIKVGLESVFHDSKIVDIQAGESVYLRPATGYLCPLYTTGSQGNSSVLPSMDSVGSVLSTQ